MCKKRIYYYLETRDMSDCTSDRRISKVKLGNSDSNNLRNVCGRIGKM